MSTNSFDGSIVSSYLTTRMPPWAGVRQNVMGSSIDGRPVLPANSTTLTYETVSGTPLETAASAAASAAAATARGIVTDFAFLSPLASSAASRSSARDDKLTALLAQLDSLTRELNVVSQQLLDLRQQVSALKASSPPNAVSADYKDDDDKLAGMVSKGEEDNMAIIKEFMRFKVHMEGSVNGHEFEIEGEGEGRPYEGTQTAKLKVTKGGPLPFAWDILSPQFMYGSKAYVKHPADIPDYLKLSFPEGFKWERVMNFEDGGVVTVTQDSSLQDGEFIYKVKLRGTNFPSDGPVMQKKTMGWEASSERMYPEDGALKGEIKQRLKLKDGGHYDAEVKTTYKAKKPVQLPGAYNVNIKLDITSHNEDYTIVEQYERAEGRHSTGGMDELYK
nr:IX-mCherry fusion protein [Mastadenovirus vector Ad5-3-SSTRpIXcherry]AIS25475.1 IX-mCherry fusion protein [Mastadenovirus expression vector Ad5-3d24pIXcherry-SSTR]